VLQLLPKPANISTNIKGNYPKEASMYNLAKRTFILFMAAALVMVPFGTAVLAGDLMEKDDISAPAMTADILVVRPVGIVATGVGFCVYLVSLPFSYLGGNTEEAWQSLVKSPAKFTFTRPLGDF
jgi:hypothetical protein